MYKQKEIQIFRDYFSSAVNVSNNFEFTQMKIISIKKMRAKKCSLKVIQDVIGISYKNVLKLNNREPENGILLMFDNIIQNRLYPVKIKNKTIWSKIG